MYPTQYCWFLGYFGEMVGKTVFTSLFVVVSENSGYNYCSHRDGYGMETGSQDGQTRFYLFNFLMLTRAKPCGTAITIFP